MISTCINCLAFAANLVKIDATFAKKQPKVQGGVFMDHTVYIAKQVPYYPALFVQDQPFAEVSHSMGGCLCHGVLYFACFFFLYIIGGKL